jgi:pSer/pThr/pTyr-binding forkhead associated (FHA) protein
MPYLSIKLGPESLVVPITPLADLVCGRLPNADVQLRDMKVSRLHCQFYIDSRGRAYVRDIGSSMGTSVDGRVLEGDSPSLLAEGMVVRAGDARVRYHEAAPPADASRAPAQSLPKGLIRTNTRKRDRVASPGKKTKGGKTKVSLNGPAEDLPKVDPSKFGIDGRGPGRAATAKQKGRKSSGIVEAPWDRGDTRRSEKSDMRPGVRTPTGNIMPSAKIDEEGKFIFDDGPPAEPEVEAIKESLQNLDQEGDNKNDTEVPPSMPMAVEAYQPPPVSTTGEMSVDGEVEIKPADRKVRMPTVRIERGNVPAAREEEPESQPVIPYAETVGKASDVIIEEEEDISDEWFADEAGTGTTEDTTRIQAAAKGFRAATDGESDLDAEDTVGPRRIDEQRPDGVQQVAPLEPVDAPPPLAPEGEFKPRKTRRVISRRTDSLPADNRPVSELGTGPGGETVAISSRRMHEELPELEPEQD